MCRPVQALWALFCLVAIGLAGCQPSRPFHLWDDHDLSHYVDRATEIEYPDTETCMLPDVEHAAQPFIVGGELPKEMWDLTLEDVTRITLENSKVLRVTGGRFQSNTINPRAQVNEAPDLLTGSGSGGIRTIYDTAIAESAPFGSAEGPGPEAALSAFDAQFTSSLFWNKTDRPQNASPSLGSFISRIQEGDNSTFNAQLTKVAATGGRFSMAHNTVYDQSNSPTKQAGDGLDSDWATNIELSFSQPLLAGAGVQFNRIAGPLGNFPNQISQFRGVVLARINTDISLSQFEGSVRNLVSDVENAYWELYFSYRALEAAKSGRDSALQTWKKVNTLKITGSKGGEADKEAQAREQYFLFMAAVQTTLNDLYRAENRVRFVMGIAVADGRLIRPKDEPTIARVAFDWREVHDEGLARSVELRQQKWRIKQRELELIAARNLVLPRLDAVGTYRFLGLGDDLISTERHPINQASSSPLQGTNAWQSLTSGDFQEWSFGLQFGMPLGNRQQLAGVRYQESRVARERAILEDQELEVSTQIGEAWRNIEFNYTLSETNFNRRVAAQRQVEAITEAYKAGTATLDLLLDVQRRRAEAEVAYYRAVVDYTRAITQLHFRKGSLLEYNGVYLAEGPWPAKAKWDAHRLARQRDASFYLDYGFTRPSVISQGPYLQHAHEDGEFVNEGEMEWQGETIDRGVPHEALPEEVPTPAVDDEPLPAPGPLRRTGTPALQQPKLRSVHSRPTAAVKAPRVAERTAYLGHDDDGPTLADPRPAAVEQPRKAEDSRRDGHESAEVKPAAANESHETTKTDTAVRPARYDQWQSAGGTADRSAGEADRSTTGWRRSKLQ